mmetsp:Transcript_25244/g.39083  ORF Transcript_25244/g.39083 Transcript_25244/m.39083 type:complete len:180 (-) Transcript_25244:562-1101(-)|eukprot:CAMPEP_0196818492 /NCGR_PEP_ID=MMETSP1362-20130617/65836_1 /TAXON_ID=163516 /ORGANISM="Leptocylindrus danicus, Strain CCMP1856" /LENGTH=179 /DNA_ID=CAMNT_0042196605 /DNA_START=56 /DNA_END=595 /DNA_ORIENTATION=-
MTLSGRLSNFVLWVYILAASYDIRLTAAFSTTNSVATAGRTVLGRCVAVKATPSEVMNDLPPAEAVPIVLVAAFGIGVAAQSWINFQLDGDRGLGKFLSDGRGFNRSAFTPRRGRDDYNDGTAPLSKSDPLPWLKLPQLDFVEVAGQEEISYPLPDEFLIEDIVPSSMPRAQSNDMPKE